MLHVSVICNAEDHTLREVPTDGRGAPWDSSRAVPLSMPGGVGWLAPPNTTSAPEGEQVRTVVAFSATRSRMRLDCTAELGVPNYLPRRSEVGRDRGSGSVECSLLLPSPAGPPQSPPDREPSSLESPYRTANDRALSGRPGSRGGPAVIAGGR